MTPSLAKGLVCFLGASSVQLLLLLSGDSSPLSFAGTLRRPIPGLPKAERSLAAATPEADPQRGAPLALLAWRRRQPPKQAAEPLWVLP